MWPLRSGVSRLSRWPPAKVALVQCPVWWTTDPPLGLAQLAGSLKHFGHETEVFDLSIELYRERGEKYKNAWAWEQFAFWQDAAWMADCFRDHAAFWDRAVTRILESDSPVIGFAVFLGSLRTTLEVARRLKAAAPDRVIVLGGEYFFLGGKAEELIRHPSVDAIVTGAADFAFPELVKKLQDSGRLEPCPGAVVKRDGEILSGGERPPQDSLDELPFADYEPFPLALYEDANRIPMTASRGCVRRCAFCSTREFWKGYSYMSGERIYAEVAHHAKRHPGRRHVEFYDITANGSVPSLERFAELVIEKGPTIAWKINAIIRPEMTREVLDKLAASGCTSIIYGLESGSEHVLKLMRKEYGPAVAERVLKDTHEAGIKTTANFMFGFPGETDADFRETLEFLRRNHRWLDRVYPSRTYTALEEHAYLFEHPEEFGIKVDPAKPTNLYWETLDGTNDFLVRMKRCDEFCALAAELGIDVQKGLDAELALDRQLSLAQYHEFKSNDLEAARAYLAYAELDLQNPASLSRLKDYEIKLAGKHPDDVASRDALALVRATLWQAERESRTGAVTDRSAEFSGAR
ncbi:MAG TPA: radical SAM protein [Elusimicrobiota bacterium]|nr:radical SAM protein [Elusimicrobiota bacterium]